MPLTMKTTAAPFLLAFLFSLLASAIHAEGRLIPMDDFHITVPVSQVPNPKGLEVTVWVQRPEIPTIGGTGIQVHCMALTTPDKSLNLDDRAAFMEACAAALSGKDFRKELHEEFWKTVFEVVTAEGQKRVRIGRNGVYGGGDAFLAPEEGALLKEALARASAAEAWYKLLLTADALPTQTAEAHPPKAKGYLMSSKLGGVHAEGLDNILVKGLDYVVSLQKIGYTKGPTFRVDYSLLYVTMRGTQKVNNSTFGEWATHMMEQVVLALEAAGEKRAFKFESPAEQKDHKHTVTANVAAQKVDVAFDTTEFDGKHTLVQCSFAVAQLAELRALGALEEERQKWFTEHEGLFFVAE